MLEKGATVMKTNRWIVKEVDKEQQQRLVAELQISPILANLLINRGYSDPETVREFLTPSLENLSSPFALLNMGAAVEKILQTVERREKIIVYGDYDVDGICASVILYQGLQALDANVDYYVPDRIEEGYGINTVALQHIAEAGCKLVITVDCGISSAQEIAAAKQWGLEFIVTDHHQLPAVLPDCIIVDPVMSATVEDKWKDLCGAGVAFKLVQALFSQYYQEQDCTERMNPYLDLVALATVADIVPLRGDNRILVKFGLEKMALAKRPGLAALCKIAQNGEANVPSTTLVGFSLAPRLNACGRIGDVRLGLQLLLTEDEEEAGEIAKKLDEENKNRQSIERVIYEEALGKVAGEPDDVHFGLVVVGNDWHPGVIGIVASRLVERFYAPTIVLTYVNGVYKGSGRSVEGVHLQQALSACADLLLSFGGHSQAAGLSVAPENVDAFKRKFIQVVAAQAGGQRFMPKLLIDSEISLNEINHEIYKEISKLQPTGTMNPQPLFVCRGQTTLESRTVGNNGDHLRIKLHSEQGDIFGIGFKKAELQPLVQEGSVDIAFHLDKNVFNGKTSLQMLICDIKSYRRPDKMDMVDRLFFYSSEYLKNGSYKNLAEQNKFYTKIAGVTFEQRQERIKDLEIGQELILCREPENPHDANAIAVYAGEQQLGYLKRTLAQQLAVLMDKGNRYQALVAQVTGGQEQHYGVNILIERCEEPLEQIKKALEEQREQLCQLSEEELLQRIKTAIIGENDYREKQQETIDHLMHGENVLAILGTGRGKSAIFQSYSAYLALQQKKITIIVYPLRALVNDQLQSLRKKLMPLGLTIQMGTGALEDEQRAAFFHQLMNEQIDIILTTPEFFDCNQQKFMAIKDKIGLVVVDEAHHLASHRQGYKKLPQVIASIAPRQILAVTATANDYAAEVIVSGLKLQRRVIDRYVRSNLHLVDQRDGANKMDYLLKVIEKGEKTVVYVNSRQMVVKLAEEIRERASAKLKPLICYYHGGLSGLDRVAIENDFREGKLKIIVTTSAFGEGIDIPDIHHVVLYHLSFSKEEYNQLAGRAGRDGSAAYIHLLYNRRDENLNMNLLKNTCPDRETLGKFYRMLKSLVVNRTAIELTNSQLAELAVSRKVAHVNDGAISHWLGIFEELGFLEREREGSRRYITMHTDPDKVELEKSLRYQEAMAELEDYQKYLAVAFHHEQEYLLRAVNQPIFPEAWLTDEGGAE